MSANSAANLRARSGVRLAMITSAKFALQQRTEHAAHRAAGAEDQHPLAGEVDSQVAFEIGREPEAVGVVAEQRGILKKGDGVRPPAPVPRAA